VDWIHVAQDRDQWRTVNTVMNLDYLSDCSFSEGLFSMELVGWLVPYFARKMTSFFAGVCVLYPSPVIILAKFSIDVIANFPFCVPPFC
jgi:hypothetical protein